MRTGRIVVVGLMVALASTACAARSDDGQGVATAGQPTATASSSATPGGAPGRGAPDEDAPVKFAQCMRQHGMTWFPDPDADGRTVVKVPKSVDPEKFEAAQEACQQFAPDGGDAAEPDPEMVEMSRRLAKCMRENGVPDFPDPQPNGSIELHRGKDGDGVGPGDPAFDKAEQKCSQYLPGDRDEHREPGGGAEA